MNEKQRVTIVATVCFLAVIISHPMIVADESESREAAWEPAFKEASTHYEDNEPDEAIAGFKAALALVFPEIGFGPVKESESTLASLLDDEQTAVRARYQLGFIYESQGKTEKASSLFRDALTILSNKESRYLGYRDGCKSCHFKEWKSWKKTKMAKAFDALKPGARTQIKKKFNLDPTKDYTEDPNCLACHTTGYGLPGGYPISTDTSYKVRKAAEQTSGGTCEACHGPGSKYAPIHKDVDEKARPYTQDEFYTAGENQVDGRICTRCHNRRSPTIGPDYRFDFEEYKNKNTHENFPLIYRVQKQLPQVASKKPDPRSRP